MTSAGQFFYDSDCGFCTRTVGWLHRWGVRASGEPLQGTDLAGSGIDPERARLELAFRHGDGEITWGAAAVADALASCRNPVAAACGRLLVTRALQWPARPVYLWVAKHRFALPGGSPACRPDQRRPATK